MTSREITIESPNEWKNVEHRVYVDTPGLFDTARIKQAAQEIEASLKLGGKYKTQVAWRVIVAPSRNCITQ